MENKTIKSYQKEILAKYKREKGGELRGYLAAPTRSQIRDACVYLFHRRNEKNDEFILNRFFQFKNDNNKLREIQNFGDGKFRSIENFLKGEVENTSVKNLNMISWLIDFQPRPYQDYLKSESSVSEKKPLNDISPEVEIIELPPKDGGVIRKLVITISVAFGMTLLILGVQNWPLNILNNDLNEHECMTWADSLYVMVSCDESPLSKYGTRVEPFDPMELKNMRKVEVHAAYKFFSEDDKPLIWYYKKSNKEIEYFTAPGLHPTNGETLRKITPHIIQTYVPKHMNKKSSFVQ